MKRNIKKISLIMWLAVSVICVAVENPNVSGNRRPSNTVPSANQPQRMAPTNQYGQGGNNVVTGNVAGNRYFRGVVPYGSSYYSGASSSAGTNSVQRFMRRSENPVVSDRNPGQTRAYYQPERTVSTMVRGGSSGLTRPTVQSQGQGWATPKPTTQTSYSEYRPRPLSSNDLELQKMVSQQVMLDTADKRSREKTETTETRQTIFDQPLTQEEIDALKQQETPKAEEEKKQATDQQQQILEQFRQIEDLQIQEQAEAEKAQQEAEAADQESADTPRPGSKDDKTQDSIIPEPAPEVIQAEGKRILGKHKTYASLAEEKYTEHLLAAQQFIKDGKYYKATDTYRLAAVWLPNDPRAYLGQSFTLFAAGEYMSSAFYLSEAAKLSPELVGRKFDLPKLMGSRDIYETRLVEMATWQQRSGSGELAFLTAYILFQDGKYQRALSSVKEAAEIMPDDPAVKALMQIIQSKADSR